MIPNTLPKSLQDNPRLSTWIGFEPGKVRVSTGKVEIGQGVLTALLQIAADELDVSPERIRLVSGATVGAPNEVYTAGSLSVETSGGALRLVCAEVRSLVLARAAERLGVPPGELALEDGAVLHKGAPTGLDYWALAGEIDLDREATGSGFLKRPGEYRLVGRSLPRIDLPAKLAGAAFIHDIAPDGVLHARVVRQPWPGARLAVFDERPVRRIDAAVEIVLAGDFLAVAAPDETVAARAAVAAAAACTWEGGRKIPPGIDEPAFMQAQAADDRVVDSAPPVEAPAGSMVEALYSRPFIAHASIGPSCALAEFRDGRLTVFTHSQGVYPLRAALAEALKLEPAAITVEHRQGAGCYGHNPADDAAFDAAFIATRLPGRPIRVQWSREDELGADPFGTAMSVRMAAGLDAAGRPAGWTIEIWSPRHGNRPGRGGGAMLLGANALPDPLPEPEPTDTPDPHAGGPTRNAFALYDFPQRLVHHFVPRIPVRTSSLRGLGAPCNVFAIESFMDELAEAAGMDPVAFRLANMSDPRARRVIEAAAEMAGWTEGQPVGEGRAKGIAVSRYKNRAAYVGLVAEVSVEEEVRVQKVWAAVDGGLVVNPDGALNQVEGGIVQSASWTLKEQVRFEDGVVASRTWEDYPILAFSEVPEIEIRLVGDPNDPPLGMGEVSQGPTAAAIGNAVARALGVRLRHLPLTRERIMAALLG